MTSGKDSWRDFVKESPEERFDYRLTDKRVIEGFVSEDEIEAHDKDLPEETEFDFTSAEAIDKELEDIAQESLT